jgi:modulator of FtsH protease HflC
MKRFLLAGTAAAIALAWIAVESSTFVVHETDQVILTRFGKPSGSVVTNAGPHFMTPFVSTVNRFEKRSVDWDGKPTEMPTKDKTYIVVDAFARWRIVDAEAYFLRLRDERTAQSRLDDIIGGEIRNAVAAHELIEIVRSDKVRKPAVDDSVGDNGARAVSWPAIQVGRSALEKMVLERAAPKLRPFGIELLNVLFTRINYNQAVEQTIYQRMISERQQIAERFRSEGQGEAARILGNRERELRTIESEAYRRCQALKGEADAKAAAIYTEAYNRSPETAEFYQFTKSLETLQKTLDPNTTLVLSTASEAFRLLKDDGSGRPR